MDCIVLSIYSFFVVYFFQDVICSLIKKKIESERHSNTQSHNFCERKDVK